MSPSKNLSGPSGGAVLTLLIALLLVFILAFLFYNKDKNDIPAKPAATVADEPSPAAALEEPAEVLAQAPLERFGIIPGPANPAAEALRQGDLKLAEEILRNAIQEDPSDSLKSALAGVLNSKALKDAQDGRPGNAMALLKEAALLSPDSLIIKNLASVQARSGDLEGAAETLEPLSGDPGAKDHLKRIYVKLGRERHSRGDLEGAASFFRKGLALDPGDSALASELAAAEGDREAEGGMGVKEGGRFTVRFEGGENAVAGHLIALLLEEAYLKVGSDLGIYPEARVEALLYTRETFRDVTRSPSWAGALYDGRIKIPAGGITEKTSQLESVIFHEYTHAVVRSVARGRAPVWLNEGIAQYEEGKSSAGYERVLAQIAGSGKLSLRPLEGSFMGFKSEQAQVAYLLSLSATEYIIREFGIFSVRNILENLGGGMGLDEAVSAALRISYSDLERLWAGSLKDG
ncbi:MAG TPA: hypothetical protein DDW94_02155 [Deltaproteobacteria bacterium]|nr:MAG: hypothetical protein A2Z79_09685 [Deltaproteobacteria bacterium GWA2_55_82]OGQ64993.1 MAG: hypothetical protein A3I81_01940 [Deltaproteobacteria bacterium RIFCSPLOWO2_02_FULL_55_12]OIJ73823.1 MAG: hypothetical protein A2V21_305825 [Deltaproteobacteria bacterium GWC2_55_46]HBG45771.1 hypothetical protein [Deltaproteobacteria bacterium]HCY09810.1 hypothetical protein [Deltaproteobacteria bacterium]